MKFLISAILLSLVITIHCQCNVCNTANLLACFSIDQFVPCDAKGVLNLNAVGTCGAGLICNQNLGAGTPCGAISGGTTCSTAHIAVVTTTAATTTPQTTVPISTFNANTFCAAKAFGRYAHPSFTTCTDYVYCFPNSTAMVGAAYTCMGTTLFNPTTQFCDANFTCAG